MWQLQKWQDEREKAAAADAARGSSFSSPSGGGGGIGPMGSQGGGGEDGDSLISKRMPYCMAMLVLLAIVYVLARWGVLLHASYVQYVYCLFRISLGTWYNASFLRRWTSFFLFPCFVFVFFCFPGGGEGMSNVICCTRAVALLLYPGILHVISPVL